MMHRFKQVYVAMEDLGLTITCNRFGQFIVCDKEFPGKDYYLRDAEADSDHSRGSITMMPPWMEYKVVTD
jgi:hypothetical protein